MSQFDYSTVIFFKPTLMWRLKMLFKPHDITFCYGTGKWLAQGFENQKYLAIGGVPANIVPLLPPEDR